MLNTFERNFSEPEYIRIEQQFAKTGKLPEFVMQEVSNNCINPGMQTPIARSQQEQTFELEAKYRERERQSQAAVQRMQMSSEAQQKLTAGIPNQIGNSFERFAKASALSGGSASLSHPCDYPNQRDSQGNYCGDRSAVIRPGGRF